MSTIVYNSHVIIREFGSKLSLCQYLPKNILLLQKKKKKWKISLDYVVTDYENDNSLCFRTFFLKCEKVTRGPANITLNS